MRDNRINYTVAGAFVLISIIGAVIAAALLSGRTGPADDYYAVYDNVTGVKFGTQVFYEGYPIGQVESVTPVPKAGRMEFRVDFSIIEDWRIPDDSVARIASPSLLSAKALDINAGLSPKPLKPGDQVRSAEAADLFSVAADVASEIRTLSRDSVRPLLDNLNRTVSNLDAMVQDDGKRLMGQLTAVSDEVALRAPRIISDVETLSANLASASADVAALFTPEITGRIQNTIASLDAAAAAAQAMMTAANDTMIHNRENIDQTLADMRLVADSAARHIDGINHHLDGAARNMYEFTRQIRANPGLLLGGQSPADEAAQQ
ncbi:MAG: MlaD family protein [Rhodospirillales bacterium]